MTEKDHLAAIAKSAARYRETAAEHEKARQDVVRDVVAALKAGLRPTDVAASSPFTAAYVRKVAREHGIAPAPRGGRRKRKSG